MTAKQFYSEEGQKLSELEYEHTSLLNRQGYYSKGVARLADRIEKQKQKLEKLYPSEPEKTSP